MSTVDRSAQIRAALKAKGWSSRDVSVKSDLYSMGSSIHITIKNPAVPASVVKSIAQGHESISRDAYTGEILSGGNRYVFVNYSDAALDAFVVKWRDAVASAVAQIKGSYLIPVEGSDFMVGEGSNGWGYSIWSTNSFKANVTSIDEAARWIGASMADKEA
jgi:hypothetical protein